MKAIVTRLVGSAKAQDLAEYGIALAVVGTGAAVAGFVVAGNVNTLWTNAEAIISIAAS